MRDAKRAGPLTEIRPGAQVYLVVSSIRLSRNRVPAREMRIVLWHHPQLITPGRISNVF